ncbi:MAG: 5'/3'-nucleotidase SurE [Deltaproteobacteria bacterium]|nr:5'/3'-nucleotidase SurE [Deltaproteobacteria bacterium]
MRILISNDDGIHAAGLRPLEQALSALGEVWVVAPEREQSAQSHALTMHKPLRIRRKEPRWYSVSGTPADCVYVALHHLLDQAPAIVVSGINRGANLGNDVLYSGTVAAAMEATLHGVPAVAVSLYVEWGTGERDHSWDTAAQVALKVAQRVVNDGLPPRVLLNVNVPDRPAHELSGVRNASMGVRHYEAQVDERRDPRGRRYYWIGGRHERFEAIKDSDGPLIEQGYATVTPIRADMTSYAALKAMKPWG